MPKAMGTFANRATISRIARAIQMANKTIVEFFIVFSPLWKEGETCPPPAYSLTENPDTLFICILGFGLNAPCEGD